MSVAAGIAHRVTRVDFTSSNTHNAAIAATNRRQRLRDEYAPARSEHLISQQAHLGIDAFDAPILHEERRTGLAFHQRNHIAPIMQIPKRSVRHLAFQNQAEEAYGNSEV